MAACKGKNTRSGVILGARIQDVGYRRKAQGAIEFGSRNAEVGIKEFGSRNAEVGNKRIRKAE